MMIRVDCSQPPLGERRGVSAKSRNANSGAVYFTRPELPCRTSRLSRPRLIAETRWRNRELALERPVESSFGFIADFGGDLCDRVTGRSKHLRSQLKPPARQVRHGRFVEVMVEALGQH